MKIGFTGTRDKINKIQKKNLYDILFSIKNNVESAHHGDCIGADTEFHNVCSELGINIVIHPPVKKELRAFNKSNDIRIEKSYFERNRDIVNETDILIAIPKTDFETQGGTWYTINYAKKLNKKIVILYPSGDISDK